MPPPIMGRLIGLLSQHVDDMPSYECDHFRESGLAITRSDLLAKVATPGEASLAATRTAWIGPDVVSGKSDTGHLQKPAATHCEPAPARFSKCRRAWWPCTP
ncbi:hypothetical protein MHPYR_270075 [uncultured Mycobacterium sp.]|uniref:Uncharacterized protein n=1 Tax=uncultured Mycobacterium sp. TaxID=171292 RepID=A0A1Y5PAS5_9MYCO|nr:hypothetical protein MHPYR_270075 [uncultured Mycobacterium sp.]